MTDISHLTQHLELEEEVQEIPVDILRNFVTRFREAQERVKIAEAELKAASTVLNHLSQIDIPQFLLQYGVSGIPLSTGEVLRVKQNISASVKDIDDFVSFLTERGDDDIVKTTFALGKMPTEIVQKIQHLLLEHFDITAEVAQSIHPSTLKKYVKELCGIGLENPGERLGDRYVPLQELPDSVNVYTYFSTSIDKK